MLRAARRCPAGELLIDGQHVIPPALFAGLGLTPPRQTAVVRGDALIPAISAASVLAKTFRDKLMRALARRFPGYGFERHKGYGAREHLEALAALGPCRMHRLTFRRVRPEAARQGRLTESASGAPAP
jgi:ribonuclease HII